METLIVILMLAFPALAGHNCSERIMLRGCYCEEGARVRFNVLNPGSTYRLKNHQGDTVDVTEIGGNDSRLAPLFDKESITFIATSPIMLISCRGHQGERVRLVLERWPCGYK